MVVDYKLDWLLGCGWAGVVSATAKRRRFNKRPQRKQLLLAENESSLALVVHLDIQHFHQDSSNMPFGLTIGTDRAAALQVYTSFWPQSSLFSLIFVADCHSG